MPSVLHESTMYWTKQNLAFYKHFFLNLLFTLHSVKLLSRKELLTFGSVKKIRERYYLNESY